MADEEIRKGRLSLSEKDKWLSDIEHDELLTRRESLRRLLAEKFTKHLKVPAEQEVLGILLDPKTSPEKVRKICEKAFMTRIVETEPGVTREVEYPAWPIMPGSVLPGYLSQYSNEYVAALQDQRFPHCDVSRRPSNLLKQLWFLSRALAGAVCGVKTRTAINLVGSKRPEQMFDESRAAKPVRKQRKRRRNS